MQMWLDMCSTLAVAAAARLGIADVLATSSPQESAALARAVGADATALTRLLRTLVSLGILAQPHLHTYALTSLGAVLRSDHPDSMRDLLIAVTDTPHVQRGASYMRVCPRASPACQHSSACRFLRITRPIQTNARRSVVPWATCRCSPRRGPCIITTSPTHGTLSMWVGRTAISY
jgi:hypothetical protein